MLYTGYLWLICVWAIKAQQQQSAIRCFGTGFVMDVSCPANHRIFPIEVLVGSVARSTGCPDSLVRGMNTTAEALCCSQTDSGCLSTYRNTKNDSVSYMYHVNCMGKQTCTVYTVVRSNTSGPVVYCDQIVYHVTTTLMELKYQCIADDPFYLPTTSGSPSKSGLYNAHLVLQDYADSGISPLIQQIQCSIETSECDGQIQIVAKDLRLFSEDGQCYQNLTVNETGNNAIQTFSCSDNTNFIQNLNFYISQTNHIVLTFMSSYNQSGGYLWIQLVPVNPSHSFTISCPPVEEDPQCLSTTTAELLPTITTTIQLNTSGTNSSGGDSDKMADEKKNFDIVLIVFVSFAGVVILIAIVLVGYKFYTCLCNRIRRTEQTLPETATTDHPSNSENTESISRTGQIPEMTMTRPPVLPPILRQNRVGVRSS